MEIVPFKKNTNTVEAVVVAKASSWRSDNLFFERSLRKVKNKLICSTSFSKSVVGGYVRRG